MKNLKSIPKHYGIWFAALLMGVLTVLFWRSFLPDYVHFSNDAPLGIQVNRCAQPPGAFTGVWYDMGFVGGNGGAWPLDANILLRWLLGPVGYSKFLPPAALFILGLGAWTFFRQLKLSPVAAALGAAAAMLNSTFLSSACWGVASQEIAVGMNFFALALVVGGTGETPPLARWARLALAGLCVGANVMEAADIGALFSLLIAAFVFFRCLADDREPVLKRAGRGVGQVAIVAVFAGFIALQTVQSLVGTQIQGVAGTGQDAETKAQHWDWATQWSLPKRETLGLIVPGIFGYKMDTPKDMLPALQDSYRGGVYWGGIGRDPVIDRFLDKGGDGAPPGGFMRFTGGGYYCGILVLLVAAWTLAQSFRRENSLFANAQKRMIWFWGTVVFLCLLFAWGRFAPFYALLYQLPYFSTIRNPAKFLILLSWALVILFGYGLHALHRRHLERPANNAAGLPAFDRQWIRVTIGLFGASVIGWLIYASEKPDLIRYLQKTGFPDASFAGDIAAFSIGQTGWFLLFFAGAVALLSLTIAGYFNGSRAKTGVLLLGGFLILDLGRANLPYVTHWDYKQKYEVGSLNPVVDFLAQKPYEHRVAGLPFRAPQGLELLDELYRIEWMQHHFPYYNIQGYDIVQMPRMPEDLKAFKTALAPRGDAATAPLIAREWLLTNTRYLLGAAGYLEVLNQQLDPGQRRFRIVQRFEVAPKPGIAQPTRLEELTAVPADNGNFALFDFTGALPRAKLYSNWRVDTNDVANLKTLADLNFDPAKTVVISTPSKNLPAVGTNENTGTVEFKSYAPKKIVFAANATAPSVLLLNDKFDPGWRVTVDGKPAELLRCNYLMRGVTVPAGAHEVEFDFSMPNKLLYVTLSAIASGILLCMLLLLLTRRGPARN